MNIPQVNNRRAGTIVFIETTVMMKWHNRTKAHYEALGYEFTGNGYEFECRVSHLHPESHVRVAVQCDFCKKIRTVEYREVIKANHTFCRCCARANDLLGMRFGRLVVIELDTKRTGAGLLRWICRCDCGKIKSVIGNSLSVGHSTSCGCYNRELVKAMRGEKSPHWNPNLTDEDRAINRNQSENYFWRKAVMERDGHTCQICGNNAGGGLNAHHLYGYTAYPEYQFDINNGVTLCVKHHKAFHKWMRTTYPNCACTPHHFQIWEYLE